MKTNVLLVGGGAREQAIAEALARSKPRPGIFAWMKTNNPGIAALVDKVKIGNRYQEAIAFAQECQINMAIIGPEEPLSRGLADALKNGRIPTVAPVRELARIETEKSFAMELMAEHCIPGCPKFKTFKTMDGIREYLEANMPVVLKPDGLTGGKGVKVQGEHFVTIAEALKVCEGILAQHRAVVIQEKLEGEEFTLQCFTDGKTVIPLPLVQDHKRRLVGDQGLNTGSMGSYSCANHLLPFLRRGELAQALNIVRFTIQALYKKTRLLYQGIIYGGFMITRDGVKLIEFNARFGQPEGINVLALLETDFLDICQAITNGTLDRMHIGFQRLATVVKYIVPANYGLLNKGQLTFQESDLIQIGDLGSAGLYYSSVNQDGAGIHLTSSRAVAALGTSPDLNEAERIAEQGARAITGAVAHRPDIGTAALIAKRVRHMEELRRTH